jgi:two-component system cell cycle response regulator
MLMSARLEPLDALDDALYVVDRRRTIRFWNAACERISGYCAGEVVGRRCFTNLLRHTDATGAVLCFGRCPMVDTMRDGRERGCRVWLRRRDGRRLAVDVRTVPMHDVGRRIIGAIELFTDQPALATQASAPTEVERLVAVDPTTGLPNRRYLEVALPAAIGLARRRGEPAAFALIEIDQFDDAVARFGENAGERIVGTLAGRLASTAGAGETLCRFGSAQLAVLFGEAGGPQVQATLQRMGAAAGATPLELSDGARVPITVSVGATWTEHLDDPTTVFQRAADRLNESRRT